MGMAEFAPDLHRMVSLVSAQTRSRPSGNANQQLQLITRLREAGRFAETIAPLRQLVRQNPRNPQAHHDLGLTYRLCNQLPEAIACFERAIALKPDYGEAYYNLGIVLEDQGREANAIAVYRRAIAAAPKLADAHGRLAVLLVTQGYPAQAVECFRRAAAASSDPVAKRVNRANALLFAEEFPEAELWLRRAVAIAPGNPQIRRILGIVLQKTGHFAEAISHFEQAIALDPNEASAYYQLCVSKKITEVDRPLIGQMLAQLERADINHRNRMDLHFALGKAFDELAEYAQAMQHFDMANRLARVDLEFDRAKFSVENDHLIAHFTADFVREHAGFGAGDELPILIVGMPRSGTTLVEQILSGHPMIAAGDELVFWHNAAPIFLPNETEAPGPLTFERIAADYCAVLRQIAPNALRVTDKLPANFRLIGPIHLALPRARFIHCRRHPVDTCLSNYFTQFSKAQNHSFSRGDLVYYYQEYSRLMAHWRTILPSDRFLEIDYEELIADRESMTRRLVRFSGLDWDDACLHPERNDRLIKTASVWQARQPVYGTSVERWRNYEPWLGEFRQLLPQPSLSYGAALL
jgi:tetratricopeptide (TPR) repeat protein